MTSISGGKTSAYLAANYPTDYNIFALVTTSDKSCLYPDKKLRQVVSDKIGKEFIGTLEEDVIIHTILDLEQYMGRKINWVSGMTFDEIFWWRENIGEPIKMNIGYRVNEMNRANNMKKKLNENGLLEQKAVVSKLPSGRNRWANIEWQKPCYPLIKDLIERQDIEQYWRGKPVRFAELNNCIGCFHRSASLLNRMSKLHPSKFDWFISQEKGRKKKDKFKSYMSYDKIKESNFTMSIPFDYDPEGCDSGFCGM